VRWRGQAAGWLRSHNQKQYEADGHRNPQRRKQHRLHSYVLLPYRHQARTEAAAGLRRFLRQAPHTRFGFRIRRPESQSPWPFISGALPTGIQISTTMPGIAPRDSSGAMPATVNS